ncbi:hypothetical protein BJX64DRAFT_286897 [Aspergillus heterothallicus]
MSRRQRMKACWARQSRRESKAPTHGEPEALRYESFSPIVPPPADTDSSTSKDDDEEDSINHDDESQNPEAASEVQTEPLEPPPPGENITLFQRIKASIKRSASSASYALKTGLLFLAFGASKISMYIVGGVKFILAIGICIMAMPVLLVIRCFAKNEVVLYLLAYTTRL